MRTRLAAIVCLLAAGSAGCWAVRSSTPLCPAGARTGPAGACRRQLAPRHRIPFRSGYETRVMQGYHGYRTHKDDMAFAVDFECDRGTPVVASRSGIVWAVREDSNQGCDDQSCIDEGNYVVIDHGDGTFSQYHHLQHFGALVEPGEQVCAGQAVGLCGNTGYSTGPHLHFAVTDRSHRTIPSRLPVDQTYPYPIPEATYTSDNSRQTLCPPTDYSALPRDAFGHQGIVLRHRLPLVVEPGRTTSLLAGRYYGDHPKIAVHRKPVGRGEWTDECVAVGDDGRFRATLAWPEDRYDAEFYWFMLTGSDADCRSPGWAWSYKVRTLGSNGRSPLRGRGESGAARRN